MEIIKAGEIPVLVSFLRDRAEILKQGLNNSEMLYQIENRIAALQFILDKYIINTVHIMAPALGDRFQLGSGEKQLLLNFAENQEVQEAKVIVEQTKNIADADKMEKKLIEVERNNIAACKKVLDDYIEKHPELKKTNKNEILVKLWEDSAKDHEDRIDAFDKLRELACNIYRKSSIIAAKNRISTALPNWSEAEIIRFIAESRVITMRKSKEDYDRITNLINPINGESSWKDLAKAAKEKRKVDFELQREVEVIHNKITKGNEKAKEQAYKAKFKATKSKDIAAEEVKKMEIDELKEARKKALQIVNQMRGYTRNPYENKQSKAAA